MINTKYIIIIIALLLYSLIIQYRYKAYFLPDKIIKYTPNNFNIKYNRQIINGLDGWIFPNKKSKDIMIFFHGNAGNISNRIIIVSKLLDIFPNTDIYIFDYPEFGLSEGKLIPSNIISSAYKVYDYWANKATYTKIILLGESIGSGILAEVYNLIQKLKYGKQPDLIIHLNGITSLRGVISNMIPVIIKPFILPWIEEFNAENIYLKHIVNLPKLLILHSKLDDIVPIGLVNNMVYNLRLYPNICYLKIDGSHNEPFINIKNINKIHKFCGYNFQ